MSNGKELQYKRCFMRAMPAQNGAGQVIMMIYPPCPQTSEIPEKTILGPPKDYCELWVPKAKMCLFELKAIEANSKMSQISIPELDE